MWWTKRDEEAENYAWPGLVDVFAFTLVLVLTLAASRAEQACPNCEILQLENKRVRTELDQARKAFTAGVEEEAVRTMQRIASKLDLSYALDGRSAPDIKYDRFDGEQVYFARGQFILDEARTELLQRAIARLSEAVTSENVTVSIEGRADFVPLGRDGYPPEDNVELSALRAAFVSRMVARTAPRLVAMVQVVGLGEQGRADQYADDGADTTRELRRVSFTIRPDRGAILGRF